MHDVVSVKEKSGDYSANHEETAIDINDHLCMQIFCHEECQQNRGSNPHFRTQPKRNLRRNIIISVISIIKVLVFIV